MAFAPQGKRWHGAAMTDEGDHGGAESLSHGLRSRWQLCCLTDAAYPLRVLRSSE